MAKSLAFWIESTGGNSANCNGGKAKVDLHINYWLLNQNTDKEFHYLDFGIKFEGLEDEDKLSLYFPFQVTKDNYKPGLGAQVCSRTELIQTIFNSPHKSTKNIAPTYVEITFESAKESALRVYTQIDIGSDQNGVRLTNFEKGSLLEFPMSQFPNANAKSSDEKQIPNYIRFRIHLKDEQSKKCLSQSYKHRDNPILSRLESTEIVDFRLNEVRDLPGNIQGKRLSNCFIKNIHFFLIREIDSEFKQAHANFDRCRLLEKELWDAYLNLDSGDEKLKLPPQMLIYHWKESVKSDKNNATNSSDASLQDVAAQEKYIEKFTAFAKFSKITASMKTIFTFFVIAIVLGILSGVLGSWTQDAIENKYKEIKPTLERLYDAHFK